MFHDLRIKLSTSGLYGPLIKFSIRFYTLCISFGFDFCYFKDEHDQTLQIEVPIPPLHQLVVSTL
ncbi:hypothetical protein BLOT_001982 [Blomia tropicalis]|nr:hypothetical protein BLOT_001982 [Blomia tropicalis]